MCLLRLLPAMKVVCPGGGVGVKVRFVEEKFSGRSEGFISVVHRLHIKNEVPMNDTTKSFLRRGGRGGLHVGNWEGLCSKSGGYVY